jgi:hypothetical protein
LIPCRDVQGRIVALKVRRDEPGDGPKSVYLSSAKHGGPGPGSPCHVPAGISGPAVTVRLTEGEFKADIATALNCQPTISAASGGNWPSCLPVLKALGAKTVHLAFDGDAATNRHVADALADCSAKLRSEGFDVKIERWPVEHKGIDDALAAGATIEVDEDDPREPGDDSEAEPWDTHSDEGFRNFYIEQDGEGETIKIGLSSDTIAQRLLRLTGGWPKRVGPLLFVPDGDSPRYLEKTPDLFGFIAGALPRNKQSPRANPIHWAGGEDKLTPAVFDSYLRQTAENYESVNPFPHEPPLPRHYYLHPQPRGGDGRALAEMMSRFNPASDIDRQLLLTFFLTLFWGGQPGQRPGFLFTAPDDDPEAGRGVGKTAVVRMGARLCGGHLDCQAGDAMDDVKKRMLSPEGRGRRVLLIDNLKTYRLSWGDMEGFITSDTISGRQLYVGEGRIQNLFTVCITVNGATLSKDMAQRVVIIQMARPVRSGTWEQDTTDLIERNRWEIVGDILATLKRPTTTLARYSRWGSWEQGVLSHVADPTACQATIEERQAAVDDDQAEKDLVREAFEEEIRQRGYDPARSVLFLPSRVI